MSRRTGARAALISAALRVLTAHYDDTPHAYSDAEAEYADEQLALAARELAAATDQLPPDERPVGWGAAPSATPHPTLRRPDGGPVVLDEVLALPLATNDSGADSVRGYLLALLRKVWLEEEEFSGKHPFGNSGWQWDFYVPLIRAGFVRGVIDKDGYLEEVDDPGATALILAAIDHLGEA